MIVVVEGSSAAGKTTWVGRHCDPAIVVPETTSVEADRAPNESDPMEVARFWVMLNSHRWKEAQRLEQTHGVAVCDSDPFKLHYTWTLWRSGRVGDEVWTTALEANRQAFGSGLLGLADLILVGIPDADALIRHRRHDRSRRRLNFDVHLELAEPLAEWYRAVEHLDSRRVIWQLPPDGPPVIMPGRDPQSGTELLDALLSELPAS